MNATLNIHTRRCPQCGKEFIPTASWAYKNVKRKVLWCSWKCLREDEAGIPPHVPEKPKKPAPAANPPAQPLPVAVVGIAAEAADLRPKKPRTCWPGGKIHTLGKAVHEAMMAGRSIRQAAADLNVKESYAQAACSMYRATEGIPPLPVAERTRRSSSAQWPNGKPTKRPNVSGEKTARLAASIHRIHALLAEIREEVGVGA